MKSTPRTGDASSGTSETSATGRAASRLLIVNPEYPPVGGGAGNASRFLARELVSQGHHVVVVASAYMDRRGLAVEEGVRVHRIRALRRHVDRATLLQLACFTVSSWAKIAAIARREEIDGAIAFFSIPSGLLTWWLRVRRGIPYVVSLRGGDVPGLVPELDRWHRVLRPLRRAILRRANRVVANSEGLATLSSKADPFAVKVIPNGVDLDYFRPAGANEAGSSTQFRMLFAGRLRRQKNLSMLLRELGRFAREEPDFDFRLDVAGDGPIATRLHKVAEREQLADRVTWHGWLTKDALLAQYQRADCFVSPSLYEGSPNTVHEAMACGLPVIASDVPGHRGLIEEESGFLFSLEEPRLLSVAVRRLADDPELASELGRGARRAVTELTWSHVAQQYAALFSDSVESSGSTDDDAVHTERPRRE